MSLRVKNTQLTQSSYHHQNFATARNKCTLVSPRHSQMELAMFQLQWKHWTTNHTNSVRN